MNPLAESHFRGKYQEVVERLLSFSPIPPVGQKWKSGLRRSILVCRHYESLRSRRYPPNIRRRSMRVHSPRGIYREHNQIVSTCFDPLSRNASVQRCGRDVRSPERDELSGIRYRAYVFS